MRRVAQGLAEQFESDGAAERQHHPRGATFAHQADDRAGNSEKRERAEIPDLLFVRDYLTDDTAGESRKRGHRHGKPLVIDKTWEADERPAEGADDASAEKSEKERAFEHQVSKAIRRAQESHHHAEREGRREEEHQFDFEVGIADLGVEDIAKGAPASQDRRDGAGHADLHQQREEEEKIRAGGLRVH